MDPSSSSAHEPSDHSPTQVDPISQPDTRATPSSVINRRTWVLVLAASVVAGIGSWLVVEGVLQSYKASFVPTSRPYPSAEDIVRINKARIESGTLVFVTTGSLLGLWLGLVGGLSRNSIKAAVLAGAVGLLLGGLLETGVAWISLKVIYTRLDPQSEDMLQTLLSHEALWVAIGIAGGLAFGLGLGGRGRWWRTAVGGLIGAALATVLYEFLGALAFPTAGTHQPLAESLVTRALAQILIPLGAAIGSVLAARDPGVKPGSS